jgi:hypothetical protein
MGKITTFISSGNFVVALILGGSMQYLWGMIRVMQMITILSLVNMLFPSHAMVFFEAAVLFSNMDVLSGEDLYEQTLVLKETNPLNDKFDFMGMGSMNFVENSGSFLIMFVLIPVAFYFKRAINFICVRQARFRVFRMIGVYFHEHREQTNVIK